MKSWIWAVALAGLCATGARAEWQTVAEVTTDGATKELAVGREIRIIGIEGIAGSVLVHTVWILEGEGVNPVPVARRLGPGETQDIDLGGNRPVTGLRISAAGAGRYRVRTQ